MTSLALPADAGPSDARPGPGKWEYVIIMAMLVLIVGGAAVALGGGSGPLRLPWGHAVIDGFPIGEAGACSGSGDHSCERWVALAESALDRREPTHLPVVRATPHDLDYYNPAFFPNGVPTLSGMEVVMVFTLSDGSVRGVGIGCGVGGCGADPTYP